MLDKLRNRPNQFEFIEFEGIEFRRDGFLLSGENLALIEEKWIKYISDEESRHPNNFFDYINCYFDGLAKDNLNVNLLLDRSKRFHTIKKLIPKNKIIGSFIPYRIEGHQYTVVEKNWFNFIRNSLYSSYALIDFIGIRDIISEYGQFPTDRINSIKLFIDQISSKYTNYDFLTCADNIIVKTNWTVSESHNDYSPEQFILNINELIEGLEEHAGIKSYAILTQGANYVDETKIISSGQSQNHFFMPSISVPFVEAFEIDKAARKKIRKGEMSKSRFYIEYSFYVSLNRKFYSSEEPSWLKIQEFTHSQQEIPVKYIGLSFAQLNELVNLNTPKSQ